MHGRGLLKLIIIGGDPSPPFQSNYMKKLFTTLYFLIFISILSCQKKNSLNSKISVQNIPVQLEEKTSYSFQEVFEIVDFFPIYNSQNFAVSDITQIKKIEDKLWMVTPTIVLITDLEGNLEKVIQSQGYGPLEYQKLADIHWNPYLSLIEILDADQGKIIRYDQNGTAINEWKNKYLRFSSSFYPRERSYWIYGGTTFDGEGYRMVEVNNQNDNKLNAFFPLGEERNYLNVVEANNYINSQEDLYFFYSYNDTIYSMDESKVTPEFLLDFGPNSIPAELFNEKFEDILDFRKSVEANEYVYLVNSIYFLKDNIFFRFFHNKKPISAVYSMENKSTKIIESWNHEYGSDFSKLSSFMINMPVDSDGEFLYFSVDPYAIKSEVDKLEDDPNLEQFMTENPLIKMIIKDFDNYENPYILKLKAR